jgi:sugar phosphate permease
MIAIRFLFGMGEAGAFPIATRSLSRWMLPAERGFAQGITHAGSRLGAAMTPALVVLVIANYGWRTAFVLFGMLGLVWSAVWFWYYRDTPAEHASVNKAELQLLTRSLGGARPAAAQSVPWKKILSSSTLWTLCLMYFCVIYGLYFYLTWLPTYLLEARGFESVLVLQVHDEVIVEVAKDERDEVGDEVVALMRGAAELDVPLEVNVAWGDTWASAKS